MDCFLEWYDWSWEISSNLTIWNLVYLGIAAFFLNYFVLPYLSYLSKLLNAFCKPTNFAYQHDIHILKANASPVKKKKFGTKFRASNEASRFC